MPCSLLVCMHFCTICIVLCGQDMVQMATFPISVVNFKVHCLAGLRGCSIYAGELQPLTCLSPSVVDVYVDM